MMRIPTLVALAVLFLVGCSSNRPAAPIPPEGVLGDLAYKAADYQAATHHYARHLIGHPGDLHRRTCRGIALEKLGRHEEALAEFDRVLELDPDSRKARLERSHLFFSIGDLVQAEEDLGQVLASPGFSDAGPHEQLLAYALLSQIAIRTQDSDAALVAVDRWIVGLLDCWIVG